jgi:hypothetical protein
MYLNPRLCMVTDMRGLGPFKATFGSRLPLAGFTLSA